MRLFPARSFIIIIAASTALAPIGCSTGQTSAPDAELATAQAGAALSATLASGIEGGTYYGRYARDLADRIEGWSVVAEVTGGSTANLDMLADGKADLGLAQTDVYASRIAEEPDVFGPLVVVGPIAEECVFIAHRKLGVVAAFGALAENVGEREAIISIGTAGGGMAETWNYVSSLIPEQANAEIDFRDGNAGLEALVAGDVDAVAWMTDPSNADHVLLSTVRANEELGFMDIEDARLAGVVAGGVEVYHSRSIPVPGVGDEKLDTICTSALLVARPGAPEGLMTALKAAGIGDQED